MFGIESWYIYNNKVVCTRMR